MYKIRVAVAFTVGYKMVAFPAKGNVSYGSCNRQY